MNNIKNRLTAVMTVITILLVSACAPTQADTLQNIETNVEAIDATSKKMLEEVANELSGVNTLAVNNISLLTSSSQSNEVTEEQLEAIKNELAAIYVSISMESVLLLQFAIAKERLFNTIVTIRQNEIVLQQDRMNRVAGLNNELQEDHHKLNDTARGLKERFHEIIEQYETAKNGTISQQPLLIYVIC